MAAGIEAPHQFLKLPFSRPMFLVNPPGEEGGGEGTREEVRGGEGGEGVTTTICCSPLLREPQSNGRRREREKEERATSLLDRPADEWHSGEETPPCCHPFLPLHLFFSTLPSLFLPVVTGCDSNSGWNTRSNEWMVREKGGRGEEDGLVGGEED